MGSVNMCASLYVFVFTSEGLHIPWCMYGGQTWLPQDWSVQVIASVKVGSLSIDWLRKTSHPVVSSREGIENLSLVQKAVADMLSSLVTFAQSVWLETFPAPRFPLGLSCTLDFLSQYIEPDLYLVCSSEIPRYALLCGLDWASYKSSEGWRSPSSSCHLDNCIKTQLSGVWRAASANRVLSVWLWGPRAGSPAST